MPKARTLADLKPEHLNARLATDESSPLFRHVEKEILAMIHDGHWDTYPIRLTILGGNGTTLYSRLEERLTNLKRGSGKLIDYFNTFSEYPHNSTFPQFVAKVAKARLPAAFSAELKPGNSREPAVLIIDKVNT